MRIEVNINKKYFIILLSTLVILTGIIISIAYGGTSPSIVGHSSGEVEGAVPSGFCIFTINEGSTCPLGWSNSTRFEGRTIYGTSNPNAINDTGGSNNHAHSGIYTGFRTRDFGSGSYGGLHYNQINPITSPSASSWPPYVKVLVCCKD